MSLYATPPFANLTEEERRRRHFVSMLVMGIAPPSTGVTIDPRISFWAPLLTTLVPTVAGAPTFTFSRAASPAYVSDQDGILRQAIANEARFQGARRVQNFLTNSENFAAAAWNKDTTTTLTAGQTDPLGGSTAFKIANVTGNEGLYGALAAGPQRTESVWLRGQNGGEQVIIGLGVTVTITTSWQRYTGVDAVTDTFFRIRSALANQTIYAWHAQSEAIPGAANQAPGDYVSVGVLAAPYHGNAIDGVKYFATLNANSVAGNVVTEAQGTLIPAATLLGYLCENAATNLCLQSQTFDAGAWSKLNSTIIANTQAAPDGTLTGDTFTDNATSGNHSTNQGFSGLTGGQPYTASIYMKAGTLTWAQVMYYDGTALFWGNFNLQTGALGLKHASVTSKIETLPNGWYRCSISFTATNVGNQIQILGSLTDFNGAQPSYVGTGQTMYLWGAQVETGSDPSSYVPTTTVAVTRAGDNLTYPMPTNLDGALATTYAETSSVAAMNVNRFVIALAGLARYPQYRSSTLLTMYSNAAIIQTANSLVSAAVNKGASAWSGITASICLNGGAVATGAFAAYTNTPIGIGGDGSSAVQGTVRNVKFYNVRIADAELVTMTGP